MIKRTFLWGHFKALLFLDDSSTLEPSFDDAKLLCTAVDHIISKALVYFSLHSKQCINME